MKEVTLITGPLRSGTSCVIGLLECCGFDLGKNIRVLRNPTEHNPRGHFELDLLFTINERLLLESSGHPWGIFAPPTESALKALAAQRERYFRLFLRKFDGEVCKDPLMCLTLPFWEPYWPELQRIVFCLRHPMAVAQSIEKRYMLPVHLGLKLWETYTARFFGAATHCQVFIFDFDAFQQSPTLAFASLLAWLGRPTPEAGIHQQMTNFFGSTHVHWAFDEKEGQTLPDEIWSLYLDIRSRVGGNMR